MKNLPYMTFLQVYMRNRYLVLTNQITAYNLLQLGSKYQLAKTLEFSIIMISVFMTKPEVNTVSKELWPRSFIHLSIYTG